MIRANRMRSLDAAARIFFHTRKERAGKLRRIVCFAFVSCACVLVCLLGAAFALRFLPHEWVERQIIERLAQRQITISSLKVDHLSASNLALSELHFAGEAGLKIDHVRVNYSLPKLLLGRFAGEISISDTDHAVDVRVQIFLPLFNPSAGEIILQNVQFKCAGGMVSHAPMQARLNQPNRFNFLLKNIRLDKTLAEFSAGKITGSGAVSGNVPLRYVPGAEIVLENGLLENTGPGMISISPEVFPEGNAQLRLVSALLDNFHYTQLKITLVSERDIRLELAGNNPDTHPGRPVKVNVNLTGDMLPLVQKFVLVFNDVQKFLLQETR